ncbi:MAG TPA: hypothetical protein VGK43_07935 [Solirubrobacterales bacterium]
MHAESETAAIERALPETHLAALAQQYDLRKFIKKPPKRREKYFRLIEGSLDVLTEALGGPPPDEDIRNSVVMALVKDRTYLAFVINQGGGSMAVTEDGGRNLVCAGAGAILCEYLMVNGKAPS